jgi:hypothetical protein
MSNQTYLFNVTVVTIENIMNDLTSQLKSFQRIESFNFNLILCRVLLLYFMDEICSYIWLKIEDRDLSSTNVRNSTSFAFVPLGSIQGDISDLQYELV